MVGGFRYQVPPTTIAAMAAGSAADDDDENLRARADSDDSVARIRRNDADHHDHHHHCALASRKGEDLVEVMIISSLEGMDVLISNLTDVLQRSPATPREWLTAEFSNE